MQVRDAMTTPVVTVRRETPLADAVRLLDEHAVTSLPVVDEEGHLVGLVAENDVVREAVPRDPGARELRPTRAAYPACVGDVMTAHPVSVPPHVDLPVAASLLTTAGAGCLPVVEDRRVVGVLSRHDLVAVLAHPAEQARDFRPRQEFQRSTTGLSRS